MIRFFRRYEKIVFWGVVLVILPLFGVSYLMIDVLGRPPIPPAGVIFGEKIGQEEFQRLSRRLALVQAFRAGERARFENQQAWNHLIFLRKAEEAGITVSDEEVAREVEQFFTFVAAQQQAIRRLGAEGVTEPSQAQWQRYLFEALGQVRFDRDEYLRLFEGRDLSVVDFERTLREELMIDKLRQLVRQSGKPAPERLFERYQDEHHRRRARYVAFDAAAFPVTAGAVTTEDLRAYYEQNQERFREPRRVAIAYAAVPIARFTAAVEPPSEEQLRARYEAVRERYRLPDSPAPATPSASPAAPTSGAALDSPTPTAALQPPTPTAEPRYRPFAEVREEIAAELVRERARELARATATALLEEVRALDEQQGSAPDGTAPAAAGEQPPPAAAAPTASAAPPPAGAGEAPAAAAPGVLPAAPGESAPAEGGQAAPGGPAVPALRRLAEARGFVYGESGLLEPEGLTAIEAIRHWALLTSLERLEPGQYSEVYSNDTHAFFYRLLERREPRLPPFAEVEDRVRALYLEPPADELQLMYERNLARYREPERVVLSVLRVPLAKFAGAVRELPEGPTRTAALRERAEQLLAKLRERLRDHGPDEQPPDLELLALELGIELATVTTPVSGAGLPEELRLPEVEARLAGRQDQVGELSPSWFAEPSGVVFAYRVERRLPARTPPLAEIRDRVREDLLAERALGRARRAAEAFAARAATQTARFAELAAAQGLELRETALLGRADAGETTALGELAPIGGTVIARLFEQTELGSVFGPLVDTEHRRAVVLRWVERARAPAEGFAPQREQLYRDLRWEAGEELLERWQLDTRLQARGIGEAMLRELYGLRYGEGGLEAIEVAQLYVPADAATIERLLEERARRKAEAALAAIQAAPDKKEELGRWARAESEDEASARKSGILRWFGRNTPGAPFDDPAFVEAAFGAEVGQVVGPVRTRYGYHVILVTGRRADQVQVRHVLYRTSPGVDATTGRPRPLPAEVLEPAMAAARRAAEQACARLQAGETFAAVAASLAAQGARFEQKAHQVLTAFERAVLAAPLEQLSEVVQLEAGRACVLWIEPAGGSGTLPPVERPRLVRAIFGTPEAMERARRKLAEIWEEELERARGTGPYAARRQFVTAFEQFAREHSDSPSAATGGLLGRFEPPLDLLALGQAARAWLETAQPGALSEPLAAEQGYYVLRVRARRSAAFQDARRALASALLEALER
ncbi:MAG: hypothetical protein KatS3mg102_2583 [Planctomycetota bacterium]|nr:MAG: hypothetical protein KatS3mg102_2583 [Planctomycetota bacterium]